jgi:hypothetical protein
MFNKTIAPIFCGFSRLAVKKKQRAKKKTLPPTGALQGDHFPKAQ